MRENSKILIVLLITIMLILLMFPVQKFAIEFFINRFYEIYLTIRQIVR
jgi:hypothetical protein